MKYGNKILTGISAFLLFGMVGLSGAQADIFVFNDQAAWEAALAGPSTLEDFNSVTTDVDFGGSSTIVNNITLASNASGSLFEAKLDALGDGGLSSGDIDGTSYFAARGLDLTGPENITVSFPSSTAFGFNYNNFDVSGDPNFTDTLRMFIGATAIGELEKNDGLGTIRFFGVIDTSNAFSSLKFETFSGATGGTGVFIGFDNVRYGVAAIPEPSSVMFVAAVVGLCGFRRRR